MKTNNLFSNLSLLTLVLLWFLNPSNKLIVLFLVLLFLILLFKSKDLNSSLITTFLVSSVIFVGKTHYFKLMDLDTRLFTDPEIRKLYPNGLTTAIAILPLHIVSIAMAYILLRDIFLKKFLFKLNIIDIILLLFLVGSFASSILVSKRIFLSLYDSLSILPVFILHFFLKFYGKDKFVLVYSVITVLILFQGYVSVQQFINSSPLGKNIELEKTASIYGQVVDESHFTFRPTGTLIHANDLAAFVAVFLPLIISALIVQYERSAIAAFFSGMIILALSLSRSVWLGAIVSLLYFFNKVEHDLKINLFTKFRKAIILLLVVMLPLLVFIAPRLAKSASVLEPSGGLTLRIRQGTEVLELFKNSPLLGVGPRMSVMSALEKNKNSVFTTFPVAVHNFYLLTMVEKGLIGLFLFLAIIYLLLKDILLKIKKNSILEKKIKLYGIFSGILILLIVAFFQPFFFFTETILLYHLANKL
ncbi:hypothetical protein A2774_02720 [Candidatus Roizmanbacteria bacterium RIFCSPHIGHO2_01_FULL_39_12c]|uniref:O-antigen ligase-related domain-containing protein n=1 Tax=Candidatus Roizmanbacteria bacterium RIFCSPHIGHO2_01_FULL_39_12c TaxID=1802031 RepID=A0A1F7GAJ1_9BACT|nr:MAG: hypothetical protein A2774_02720 [Candidatus Roizmanbacteria bacterium RIFCSPHIGHO2_01_FULL_39_12c]